MQLDFQPLSKVRLGQALALIKANFPDYLEQITKVYNVSLENNKHDEYWKTRRILEYWMVIDRETDNVVALTGFYQLTEHNEKEIWLGWFCVDAGFRGKGIGKKTLEWTINEARKRGYEFFRLWTTTSPDEAVAKKLYEGLGLHVYKTELNVENGETVLYRELKL